MSNVSSVIDYFSTANEGFATTLGTTISSGATTVPLAGTAGLTNGTVFVGIIEPGATNQQVFTGTVDTADSQISNVVWTRGTNNSHVAGVAIVDYVTGTAFNMLTTGILKQHTQTGTHTGITTDTITTSGNATINGTLDPAGGVTPNTVSGAALETNTVGDAQLVYGKVRRRQGGSPTDWSAVGTNAYDYTGTNTFIQLGTNFANSSPFTVTFNIAFNQKPLVMAVVSTVNTTSCFVVVLSSTVNGFTCQVYDNAGSTNSGQNINWIAVGQ